MACSGKDYYTFIFSTVNAIFPCACPYLWDWDNSTCAYTDPHSISLICVSPLYLCRFPGNRVLNLKSTNCHVAYKFPFFVTEDNNKGKQRNSSKQHIFLPIMFSNPSKTKTTTILNSIDTHFDASTTDSF